MASRIADAAWQKAMASVAHPDAGIGLVRQISNPRGVKVQADTDNPPVGAPGAYGNIDNAPIRPGYKIGDITVPERSGIVPQEPVIGSFRKGGLVRKTGAYRLHKGEVVMPAKLGSGGRFAALKAKLGQKKGIHNPGALAAAIGRKKYGNAKMAAMSAHGRKNG